MPLRPVPPGYGPRHTASDSGSFVTAAFGHSQAAAPTDLVLLDRQTYPDAMDTTIVPPGPTESGPVASVDQLMAHIDMLCNIGVSHTPHGRESLLDTQVLPIVSDCTDFAYLSLPQLERRHFTSPAA